jgi:hypothetical protein
VEDYIEHLYNYLLCPSKGSTNFQTESKIPVMGNIVLQNEEQLEEKTAMVFILTSKKLNFAK